MRGEQCERTDINHRFATSLEKVAGDTTESEGSVAHLFAVVGKHSELQTLCLADRPVQYEKWILKYGSCLKGIKYTIGLSP